MPKGNDFSPLDPTETVTNTWDFGPWLTTGVTVSTPSTTCTVLSGSDPGSAGRLLSVPVIRPSPTDGGAIRAILHQVSTRGPGAGYLLLFEGHTYDSEIPPLFSNPQYQRTHSDA